MFLYKYKFLMKTEIENGFIIYFYKWWKCFNLQVLFCSAQRCTSGCFLSFTISSDQVDRLVETRCTTLKETQINTDFPFISSGKQQTLGVPSWLTSTELFEFCPLSSSSSSSLTPQREEMFVSGTEWNNNFDKSVTDLSPLSLSHTQILLLIHETAVICPAHTNLYSERFKIPKSISRPQMSRCVSPSHPFTPPSYL